MLRSFAVFMQYLALRGYRELHSSDTIESEDSKIDRLYIHEVRGIAAVTEQSVEVRLLVSWA